MQASRSLAMLASLLFSLACAPLAAWDEARRPAVSDDCFDDFAQTNRQLLGDGTLSPDDVDSESRTEDPPLVVEETEVESEPRYLIGESRPWSLLPKNHPSRLRAGGWAQVGYYTEGANDVGTGVFLDQPNAVDLEQGWIFAERPTDTSIHDFDWGFRIDYLYGAQAPDTQAFGGRANDWDNGWNNGANHGHAIPQLYVDAAYRRFKVRAGHFQRILGYETVAAPFNFFPSRSYSMALMEPITHGGAIAEYTGFEKFDVLGGWSMGWDTAFSSNGGDVAVGGLRWRVAENLSATYMATAGDFGFDHQIQPGDGSDRDGYSHDIVIDWRFRRRWNYVFQSDYVDNDLFLSSGRVSRLVTRVGGPTVGVGSSGNALSVNQYVFYRVNDAWKVGGRVEWLQYGGLEISEFTLGLNYRPHANLLLRPEVRLDNYPTLLNVLGVKDSTLFTFDAILVF